jgi:hypothetical protein
MFRNQSAQQFHSAQVATLKRMLAKHKNDIAMAK